MLPIDLILVRHGQSEGNVAHRASERGDNKFFTPAFRERHSRTFRLTDKGIGQAQAAGAWIRENIHQPFDRFYVSDYARAEETAGHLGLPNAEWRVKFQLRERDKALMDNMPADDQKRLFAMENRQYALNPFLSYPAGGGESIATLCLRLKAGEMEHWARECFDKRITCICHGHVMRALQLGLEGLGNDDFIRLDASEDRRDKIRNCQILWYTRRDPDTKRLAEHLVAVRSVCHWDKTGDYGWREIKHHKLSNKELLEKVERYSREVNCS